MQKAIAGEVTPVLSVAVLAEYADVLHRPENRVEGWRDQDIQTLIDGLLVHADWAEPYFRYRPCLTDEGDELILEAAINGRAGIVTFNRRHFRSASRFGVEVYKPREILEILSERGMAHGTD